MSGDGSDGHFTKQRKCVIFPTIFKMLTIYRELFSNQISWTSYDDLFVKNITLNISEWSWELFLKFSIQDKANFLSTGYQRYVVHFSGFSVMLHLNPMTIVSNNYHDYFITFITDPHLLF